MTWQLIVRLQRCQYVIVPNCPSCLGLGLLKSTLTANIPLQTLDQCPACQTPQDFIESRITRADTMVVSYAVQKVVSGDVIMTFAYSHVVYQVGLMSTLLWRSSLGRFLDLWHERWNPGSCKGQPWTEIPSKTVGVSRQDLTMLFVVQGSIKI